MLVQHGLGHAQRGEFRYTALFNSTYVTTAQNIDVTGSDKVNVSAGCSGGQTASVLASKLAADGSDLLGTLTLSASTLLYYFMWQANAPFWACWSIPRAPPLTVAVLAYLREVATVGAAWALGLRDPPDPVAAAGEMAQERRAVQQQEICQDDGQHRLGHRDVGGARGRGPGWKRVSPW